MHFKRVNNSKLDWKECSNRALRRRKTLFLLYTFVKNKTSMIFHITTLKARSGWFKENGFSGKRCRRPSIDILRNEHKETIMFRLSRGEDSEFVILSAYLGNCIASRSSRHLKRARPIENSLSSTVTKQHQNLLQIGISGNTQVEDGRSIPGSKEKLSQTRNISHSEHKVQENQEIADEQSDNEICH